jgi:malate dehydrogenase
VGRSKITVVGAGNVGAAAAQIALSRNLADVVLIDIVKGLADGKALDLAQAGPLLSYDCKITGTQDWAETSDSNIVIITSGLPRKPGMSRDDLIAKNTQIVKSVTEQIKKYSPDCFIIVVCNPLDAMVYTAAKTSGFEKNKIMGMAGALDCARFNCFIAQQLGVSVEDVQSILMGGHGDDMVPLPRFTTVKGIPLTDLMEQEKIDAIVERTRNGGIEIVNLLGYSAYYAPAAGAIKMTEAILKDTKAIIPCCAYCNKEYNAKGFFVGVPVILGSRGVEKVIELDLNKQEQSLFNESLTHVKQLVEKVDNLLK